MTLVDKIKIYFGALGEELGELFSNIWNNIKSVKWIIILSSILLFTIGCFIWKPLLLSTFVLITNLGFSFLFMLIPITLSVLIFIMFHLNFLYGEEEKYPILNMTLGFICGFIVFIFGTLITWDIVLKEIWVQPELWNQILNL